MKNLDFKGRYEMKRLKWLGAIAAIAMISGTASLAQEQLDLPKMAKGMRQNQEELRR